ncbi:MAG: hypothetical protein J6S02_08330, partial [Bacteroidaceae bacterium]|nr:hypothetical protein [Bacteroidaceae bacterium]
MAKELSFLTKRSEDYSKWYNELVVKADLAEQADVRACFDAGVHNIPPELVKILGRLKYRTSYGQNVLM